MAASYPRQMKAVAVDRFGPPSALTLHEVPVPRPGPHEAPIAIDSAGIAQRRRKITPTLHERMIWGQADGSGLRAVDSEVGRIGQRPAGNITTL